MPHRTRLDPREFLDADGQVELFHIVRLPGREPPGLEVVASVSQVELGPYAQHLRVEQQDPAVVEDVLVHDGHAHIAQYPVRDLGLQDVVDHLPAVDHRVVFVEVVLARVTRHLELRPHAQPTFLLLGLFDRLHDVVQVVLEVQGVLVQRADGGLDELPVLRLHGP